MSTLSLFPLFSSSLVPCSSLFWAFWLLALDPVLCFNVGPWELKFTAKQEEPVSRKLGMGQGVNDQQ
jgi:hypothetical protein